MSDPTAELLQGLEHVNEEVRRLAQVLRQVLEAQQRGKPLSAATVANYLEQLTRVEADSQRIDEMVLAFWAMLGKEQAH